MWWRRYAIWFVAAAVALPVYALASAADISQVLVLIITFIGAMVGTVIGNSLIQRR
jgi:hypothetical protein